MKVQLIYFNDNHERVNINHFDSLTDVIIETEKCDFANFFEVYSKKLLNDNKKLEGKKLDNGHIDWKRIPIS